MSTDHPGARFRAADLFVVRSGKQLLDPVMLYKAGLLENAALLCWFLYTRNNRCAGKADELHDEDSSNKINKISIQLMGGNVCMQ
jgi:hypothetical protein